MDCHVIDVDMMIEDEGMWDVHMQDSAFDAPLETDGTAATEMMDPPTDAEHAAELVAAEEPEGEPECHKSVAAGRVARRRRWAVSLSHFASTPARGNGVVVTEETPVAAQQCAAQQSASRRRLVGKQRPPDPCLSKDDRRVKDPAKIWAELNNTVWEALSERQRYDRVKKRLDRWLDNLPPKLEAMQVEPPVRDLLRRAWMSVRALGMDERHRVVLLFLQDTQAPNHICNCAVALWPQDQKVCQECCIPATFLYARSVLLTWNGDWGVIADLALAPDAGWRVVVASLKTHPVVVALWREFSSFCEGLSESLGALHHAFTLDLCFDSWEADKTVRVHGNLYLNGEKEKLILSTDGAAAFKDSVPHKSHKVAAMNNRRVSGSAGCYYLVCPRIGVIYRAANARAYKHLRVRSEWIMNMVQAEKMECSDARLELTRCSMGYKRRLAELIAWERRASGSGTAVGGDC